MSPILDNDALENDVMQPSEALTAVRWLASMAAALSLPFADARAQSAVGSWEGHLVGRRAVVTLDSSAGGWRGGLFAPWLRPDTMRLESVRVRGDSVVLRLPAEGRNAALEGTLSKDRQRLGGLVITGGDTAGTFRLARPGTTAAAELVALLTRPAPGPRVWHEHPDSARLVTTDVTLFWDVLARAPADSLEDWLAREYLARGTAGLRDFIPGRILSPSDLALRVRQQRARYDSIRPATLRIAEAEPAIRAAYGKLKALYPKATYPDVYFVIGRFNSGGTASDNGLLIGAEMYADPGRLPSIVAHELIHFQQAPLGRAPTLLTQSFREGAADFVGEMISEVHVNSAAHRYGGAHERELWKEFKARMNGASYAGWMYGDPPGERPADLGYFIGYRIAHAYYERAADKRAALRDIIRGVEVERILAESGYDP